MIEKLVKVQETLGMLLLSLFFLAILAQISARYMSIPLVWTEELGNYSFIWAVFMGASVMVYHKGHFSFTFFSEKFQGRRAVAYDLFISIVLLCFTIPMTFYGAIVVMEFWDYNWITLTWVKMGYTWLCLPITGATMTLYLGTQIAGNLKALSTKEAPR